MCGSCSSAVGAVGTVGVVGAVGVVGVVGAVGAVGAASSQHDNESVLEVSGLPHISRHFTNLSLCSSASQFPSHALLGVQAVCATACCRGNRP
jgi:hypothetical protein